MKKILILFVALLFCAGISAQKRISILDAETHNPVPGVIIADTIGEISKGSAQGLAVLPKRQGMIIFSQPYYERLEMDYDSIGPVIHMKRLTMMIDEVEVRGVGNGPVDRNALKLDDDTTDMELSKAGKGNGNLLSPFSNWLFNRKSKKEKHLEKEKEVLDNY